MQDFKDFKEIELKVDNVAGVPIRYDWRVERRWRVTRNFLLQNHICCEGNVLDIGGDNLFGKKMSNEFGLNYFSTMGDLDYHSWTRDILNPDVIFCFEVLEHLMNPLLFLNNLKRVYGGNNPQVFITYPNNLFRSEHHFHEYKDDEFYTLIRSAGYYVIDYQKDPHWHNKGFYFTGIKPLARLTWQILGKSKLNLYYLKMHA